MKFIPLTRHQNADAVFYEKARLVEATIGSTVFEIEMLPEFMNMSGLLNHARQLCATTDMLIANMHGGSATLLFGGCSLIAYTHS